MITSVFFWGGGQSSIARGRNVLVANCPSMIDIVDKGDRGFYTSEESVLRPFHPRPKTGNGRRNRKYLYSYIAENITDNVEIPTTNSSFSTATISVKLSASDRDKVAQPEISATLQD